MKLPGWAQDDSASLRQEAAPYVGMSQTDKAKILAELCRAAAKQLSFRSDRQRLLDYQDPLPESTVAALERLRRSKRQQS